MTGEPGSGKSTQIPKLVMLDNWENGGRVVCTQPRRLGATSLATRVAQELGKTIPCPVGFTIGSKNVTAEDTRLVFVTDGHLLHRATKDPLFQSFVSYP